MVEVKENQAPNLVSVIVPTYERKKFLSSAIESVQAQTYKHFEIIIVDDGSTDGTAALVDPLSETDTRIRYHYQQNRGPAAARNTGIQFSQGAYIAFLDSDDLWLPQKLEKQVAVLSAHPEVGLVYCNGYFVDETGNRDELLTESDSPAGLYSADNILFDVVNFYTSSIIFRKEVLKKAGAFDESLKFYEDVDLWFRILLFYASYYLEEELVIKRKHASNFALTHSAHPDLDACRSAFQMRQKAVRLFEQNIRKLSPEEKKRALYEYEEQLIKESLANGIRIDARRESWSYLKNSTSSIVACFYLLLSFVPGNIVPYLIRKHRKKLQRNKTSSGSLRPRQLLNL